MLASLNAANPPLNDPGVTMNVDPERRRARTAHLRHPDHPVLVGRAERVRTRDERLGRRRRADRGARWTRCARPDSAARRIWDGTLCQIEQRTVDLDDNEVTLGESHFVRGDGWVSTAWINFAPEGYTEDIVAHALGLISAGCR